MILACRTHIVAGLASYGLCLQHSFSRLLCSHVITVFVLLRWRPVAGRAAWVDSHPGRVAGAAVIAAALCVAIDWSQVDLFLIAASARAGGASSLPGLDYLVCLPGCYHRSLGRWPLILALHGAGRMGHDIDPVRAGGIRRHLQAGGRLPLFLVVARKTRFRLVAKHCRARFVNPQGCCEGFPGSNLVLLSRAYVTLRPLFLHRPLLLRGSTPFARRADRQSGANVRAPITTSCVPVSAPMTTSCVPVSAPCRFCCRQSLRFAQVTLGLAASLEHFTVAR